MTKSPVHSISQEACTVIFIAFCLAHFEARLKSLRPPYTPMTGSTLSSLIMTADSSNFYNNTCVCKLKKKYKWKKKKLWPRKNKNRKKWSFFCIVSISFLEKVMATPFDEFLQKLAWIQFKGKIRELTDDFLITSIVFF